MKFGAVARIGGGCAVAGVFLWLVLRKVDLAEIGAALAQARAGWLVAAVACFFTGYAFRVERWRQMLRHDNPRLRWRDCGAVLMISVAANNLLPLRAGDVVRAFTFNRRLGIGAATSLSTLLVERLLDTLMLIALLGAAVLGMKASLTPLSGLGGWLFVMGSAAILALLLAPGAFRPLANWGTALVGRVSARAGAALGGFADKVFGALGHMAQAHVMARLLVLSACAWVLEGLVFLCAAMALPSLARPVAAWLALPLGTLATIIPGTPGFVGTFDYFTTLAMRSAGNALAPATAYALLVHALLWLPATLAGGLAWLTLPAARPAAADTPEGQPAR